MTIPIAPQASGASIAIICFAIFFGSVPLVMPSRGTPSTTCSGIVHGEVEVLCCS